jgi:glucose/mannose-6-phosphate isomerase
MPMNLDDLDYFRSLDSTGLLAAIDALPEQWTAAWGAGSALTLDCSWEQTRHVVLAGMGPAGVAAELAAAWLRDVSPHPVMTWRDFGAPASAGPGTVLLALAPDGDDEETLDAAQAAAARGAWVAAIARGGALAQAARARGWPLADLAGGAPAQLAAGPLAAGVLGVLRRLAPAGLEAEAAEAARAVQAQQAHLRAASPVSANPAKRMAGQLLDRLPYVFAAEPLAAVARHWKAQINVLAKAPALCDVAPDMDHSAIAGTRHPEALVSKFMVLALRSTHAHPRAQWLVDETRTVYMTAGFNTDAVEGTGGSRLAHMLTALHYGDYAAYYLAMCYGVDPAV